MLLHRSITALAAVILLNVVYEVNCSEYTISSDKGPFSEQVIKTHDSESRGQEEAGRTRRTSELFTRSTALKFVNALNKPP